MQDISGLESQVANTVGVEQSAATLINGFAARLADAGTDPAKLAQLQSDLKDNSDALAAAVAANSPIPVPPIPPVNPTGSARR